MVPSTDLSVNYSPVRCLTSSTEMGRIKLWLRVFFVCSKWTYIAVSGQLEHEQNGKEDADSRSEFDSHETKNDTEK